MIYVDLTGYHYEVDLDRCLTSAQTLDWICQVTHKSWATDAVLAGLVRALDDILQPQASLCSDGRSKQLSRRQLAAKVTAVEGRGQL